MTDSFKCAKNILMLLLVAAAITICSAARAENKSAPDSARPEVVETKAAPAAPKIKETTQAWSSRKGDVFPTIKTREDYFKAEPPPAHVGMSAGYVLRTIASLIIVVILIFVVLYFLRQFWARGMRFDLKGHHIRVLDVINLGMNRTLFLVSVGKKVVLLGSTEKGLGYLMEAGEPVEFEESPGSLAREGGVEFQSALETAMTNPGAHAQRQPAGPVSFMDKLKGKLKKLDEDKKI
jgi:flagellar biogenesis protein FliO